jgi:hypothetical protein
VGCIALYQQMKLNGEAIAEGGEAKQREKEFPGGLLL